MLIRVFTLAFEPMTGRFNDDPVRDFIVDKEVASIRDHFFLKDDPPYLALVLPLGRPGSGPTQAPIPVDVHPPGRGGRRLSYGILRPWCRRCTIRRLSGRLRFSTSETRPLEPMKGSRSFAARPC
jgi:hypothetical protein